MARKKKADRAAYDQGGKPWAELPPPYEDIRVDYRDGYWLLPPDSAQPTQAERDAAHAASRPLYDSVNRIETVLKRLDAGVHGTDEAAMLAAAAERVGRVAPAHESERAERLLKIHAALVVAAGEADPDRIRQVAGDLRKEAEEIARSGCGHTIRLKRRLGQWSVPQEGKNPDLPLDDGLNAAVEMAYQDYLRHHNPKRARCPRCEEKPGCAWCAVEAAGGPDGLRREIAEVADDPDAVLEVLARLGLVPKAVA